ncbi:hypothetical protein ACWDR3_00655 [Streptomyces sp. NPDC001002]
MDEVDLRQLRRRIPQAGDRALAEIVNGLATVEDMTAARARHGFFGRVLLGWNRKDRRRALEVDAAMARTQRHMVTWAKETARHLAFTDLTVGLLAMEVEKLQYDVARVGELTYQALDEIRELAGVLTEFIDVVSRRLDEIDARLDDHERILDAHTRALLETDRRLLAVELWQSAWAESDTVVRRWRHQGAYAGLPWLCQVLLLARECAAGRPGLHEFVTGDRSWRGRLADDILSDPRSESGRESFGPGRAGGAPGRRSVRALVDRIIAELPDADERQMVAEVLGIGLSPRLRPPHRPVGYAVARGLELSARQPLTSEDPAREAAADARRDYGHLELLTYEEFVHTAIREQADAAHQARTDLHHEQEKAGAMDDAAEGGERGV